MRAIGIELDLLSQSLDERPKVIDLIAIVGTPYRLQQFPMRHDFIRMLGQIAKKVQFLRRQVRLVHRCGSLSGPLKSIDKLADMNSAG